VVNPLTDFPERFHDLEQVFIEGVDQEPVALRLEWVRVQGDRPVLKFYEVTGIGEAEQLAGREIRIPESELVALPAGSLFHFELHGCEVWDRSQGFLGVVEDIMVTGGTDVLVVRDSTERERLIPICKEICCQIEPDRRRIEIQAPEGLLELNAR
jgi:16S rRNA processing protein RimM